MLQISAEGDSGGRRGEGERTITRMQTNNHQNANKQPPECEGGGDGVRAGGEGPGPGGGGGEDEETNFPHIMGHKISRAMPISAQNRSTGG
jgi:hypothetical protein